MGQYQKALHRHMWNQRKKEERECVRKVFEEAMVRLQILLLNLVKDHNLKLQLVHRTPKRINMKNIMLRHMILKLKNVKIRRSMLSS